MQAGVYRTYRQTDILTADPKKLVIMCYEEAIRSLHLATLMYSSRKYEAKGKAVEKALNIISELREALDFERGGTIATSLNTLYAFMLKHILESDMKKDPKGFGQVATMLEQLKSAWERIFFGYQEAPMTPATNINAGNPSPLSMLR